MKPRIWFANGRWFCSRHRHPFPRGGMVSTMGMGNTPLDAFRVWELVLEK